MTIGEKLKQWFLSFKSIAILILLMLLGIISLLVYKSNKANSFISLLQSRLKAREKELNDLRTIQEEQIRRQQKIDSDYQQVLRDLETNHNVNIRAIDESKQQELKDIVGKYSDNPETQAQHLRNMFGL